MSTRLAAGHAMVARPDPTRSTRRRARCRRPARACARDTPATRPVRAGAGGAGDGGPGPGLLRGRGQPAGVGAGLLRDDGLHRGPVRARGGRHVRELRMDRWRDEEREGVGGSWRACARPRGAALRGKVPVSFERPPRSSARLDWCRKYIR